MRTTIALLTLATFAGAASAQEPIAPETLTVEKTIKPGPNVLVMDFGIVGASPVYVFGADDYAFKGNMGTGTFANMVMAPDGKTLYTVSDYLERYSYGKVHTVVHEFDVQSLTARREFEISDKFAQAISQPSLLNLADDGKFLLVQNATPATSVSIVDLAKGAQVAEVPTPGCWTAMPAAEGRKFTVICGDGTFVSYGFDADGKPTEPAKSAQIFDADKDPLFSNPVRVGDKLVYASFGGTFYVVDDSGGTPKLAGTTPFAQDDWAPGGMVLLAYHKPSNTIFVLMHKGATEGSHKHPAEEIWAVDGTSLKVKGRSPANEESIIAVTRGDTPDLWSLTETGSLVKYSVTLGDEVKLTKASVHEGAGVFLTALAPDY